MSPRNQAAGPPFIVVTPAHNEEAFIEKTVQSMIRQSVRPSQWIVVNDASTDRTHDIVAHYAAEHPFIKLVDVVRGNERHFGHKARAFLRGLDQCTIKHHAFIGNLDADISLEDDYYERVLREFALDPALGVAGGMVSTLIGDRFVSQEVSLDSVAGAVQMFRRACFEQIGGYRPMPRGGIDAAAEITARMHGWKVRTFPELRALEHRRTGTATRAPLASRVNEGMRFHSLGYGAVFFGARCLYRSLEPPRIIGSLAAAAGYAHAALTRSPIALAPEVVRFLRHEQRDKLMQSIRSLIYE